MMKIVVDTNVIISAAISPTGNAAKIVNSIADREKTQLIYSSGILAEYEEVLSRKHLHIAVQTQSGIIETIKDTGTEIESIASDIPLPDESDRIFYDTARKAGAILITGNKKHYPQESFIMAPAEFLQFLKILDKIG